MGPAVGASPNHVSEPADTDVETALQFFRVGKDGFHLASGGDPRQETGVGLGTAKRKNSNSCKTGLKLHELRSGEFEQETSLMITKT